MKTKQFLKYFFFLGITFQVISLLFTNQLFSQTYQFTPPVANPVTECEYSYFSFNVYSSVAGGCHAGVDYHPNEATNGEILAVAPGKVVGICQMGTYGMCNLDDYDNDCHALGNTIMIEHELLNGTILYSMYSHLSSINVFENQYLEQEDIIGYMGATGASAKDSQGNPIPHLHFEFKNSITLSSPNNSSYFGYVACSSSPCDNNDGACNPDGGCNVEASGYINPLTVFENNNYLAKEYSSINGGVDIYAGNSNNTKDIYFTFSFPHSNFELNNFKINNNIISSAAFEEAINLGNNFYRVQVNLPNNLSNLFSNGIMYDISFQLSDNNTNYVYLIKGNDQLYFAAPEASSFNDLVLCTNKSEYEYIEKVIQYGLFKGENNIFKPNDNLTREEAAKLICQLAINAGIWTELDAEIGTNGYFEDVDICNEFFPFVQTLRNKGVVNAITHFNGGNSVTFAQLCKMAVLAFDIESNGDQFNYQDYNYDYISPADPSLIPYMEEIGDKIVLVDFFGNKFAEPLISFGEFNAYTFNNSAYTVNGDDLITRAESAILFANLYEHYRNLNNSSFPTAKIQTNDLSDWNIVGGKLKANGNSNSATPNLPSQTSTIYLDNGETFTSNTGLLSDSNGNPVTYFWAIEGGTLNSLAAKHNKVEWIAPTVSQTTTYELYVFVQNSLGNYTHGVFTIIVSPETTGQPTLQADNIQFENTTYNSSDMCWDRGNGAFCIVTATPTSFSIEHPEDGTSYGHNSHFSSAPFVEFGKQTRVIYVGTGNELTLTGLNESTWYKIRVYEFNTGNEGTNYLTFNPASGVLYIPSSDTQPWFNMNNFYPSDNETLTSNSVTLSFPATGGDNPKRYTVYLADWHPTGEMPIVENTTNTTFTVTDLSFNETYYWKVYVKDADNDEDWSQQIKFTIAPETNPPTGSINISNGASTTNSIYVNLNLSASDSQGEVTQMQFSNNGVDYSGWHPYSSTYTGWNLGEYGGTTYYGTKTVYAQFKDNSENVSTVTTDNIELEEGVPGYFIVRDKQFASLRVAIEYANSGDVIYATAGYFDLSEEAEGSPYSSFSTGTSIGAGLKDGVSLVGEGPEKTTLYWNEGNYGLVLQGNNIVEGLTLIRPPKSGTTRTILGIGAASNCTIRNCVLKNSDRAIRTQKYNNISPSNITIENCQIYDNESHTLYLWDIQTINIYNTIIYNNKEWALYTDNCSNMKIKNNIVTSNGKEPISIANPGNINFTHNNVWNNISSTNGQEENYSDCSICLQDQTGINGNISQNPQFEDAVDHDFHLKSNSPCINTGINVGNPYIGSNPDMGVFEYNATGTLSIVGSSAANYLITKPDGSTQTLNNNQSLSNAPLGMYGVFPQEKQGYYTPEVRFFYIRAGETKVYNLPYILDTQPPTGEILVNGGEYFTQSRYVTIFNDIVDEVNGIGENSEMQFSNDGVSWSSAEPISNKKRLWDLEAFGGNLNEGEKIIYAKFSDENGYWSGAITDIIQYKPNGNIIVVPTDISDVDDALESADIGDIVYVLPGTYEVNQDGSWGDVYVELGRKLQGSGIDNTIFNFGSYFYPKGGSSIDGISFTEYSTLVYIEGSTPNIFSNCKFDGVNQIITITDGNQSRFRNCVFRNLSSWTGFLDLTSKDSPMIEVNNCVFDASISNLDSGQGKKGIYVKINSEFSDEYPLIVNNIFKDFDTDDFGTVDSQTSGGIVVENDDDTPSDIIIQYNNFTNCVNDVNHIYGPNISKQQLPTYEDPLFINTTNYHIADNSPVKNIGTPNLLYRNHDGTPNTLGVEGGPFFNTPPTAALTVSPISGSINTTFTFDASGSSDEQTPIEFLQFRWDFDNDGVFDTDFLTSSSIEHQFSEFSEDSIVVWIFDEHFAISYMKIPNPLVSSNILVGNLSNTTLCSSESFTLSYTTNTSFNNGNIFTAELSNSAGDLINSIPLGSVNSTTSGSINCTVPTGITSSDNYKIRIIASTPAETSTSTNTFSIQEAVTVSIGGGLGTSYLTTDTPISLDNLGSPSGGVFTINGNTSNTFNPSVLGEGNHTVIYTYTQGDCIFSTSRTVEVCLPIGFTLSVVDSEVCAGQAVNLSYTIDGKFETNNDFSVELSLPNGNFISPILIATIPNSSTSGTLSCTIPNYVSQGNNYQLRVIASNPYTVSSVTNGFNINEAVFPTISISNSPSEICEGESVTFTATYTNEGSNPIFQWKKNNVNIGTNSSTYTTSSLEDGDVVSIEFTSNANCVSSSAINDVLTSNINQCSNCVDGVSVTYNNTSNLPSSTVVSDFIIVGTGVEVTAGQNIEFRAGDHILFEPGSEVNGSITAIIQDCEVSQAQPVSQNTNSEKGFKEVKEGEQLYMKAFPNPFTDKITIEYLSLQEGVTNLYLCSIHGTKVKSIFSNELRKSGEHRVEFEPCNLSDGIYIIVLEVNGFRETFRISKISPIR